MSGLVASAYELAVRLGHPWAIGELGQWLRSLGVRPPRRATLAHPSGLTERETEVLALVREGHRNAEIAARLSISAKTVDHHVSAILGKLGARTRREAAQIEAAQHADAQHGEDAEQR